MGLTESSTPEPMLMATTTLTLRLKNRLDELETLREHLEEFARRAELADKTLFELNLALDELFTNIVTCGYRNKEDRPVDISITLEERLLTVRVEDYGLPFDPTKVATPDLKCPTEKRKIGGLGLYLVRQMTDMIGYRRDGDKNVMVLKKRITAPPEVKPEKEK